MKNRVDGKIREDLLLVLLFVKIDPNEPEDDGGEHEGGDDDVVVDVVFEEEGDVDDEEEVVVDNDGTDWESVVVEVNGGEEELGNLCCFTVWFCWEIGRVNLRGIGGVGLPWIGIIVKGWVLTVESTATVGVVDQ